MLLFKIISHKSIYNQRKPGLYLVYNDWNDFGYYSTYRVWRVDEKNHTEVGVLNIASIKYEDVDNHIQVKEEIINMPNQKEYITLGNDSYYYYLNQLTDEERKKNLMQLQDLAFNLDLFNQYKDLGVVKSSFLRSRSNREVKGKLHRLAIGQTRMKYDIKIRNDYSKKEIVNIQVNSEDILPSNIHAFIGNNGSGKTKLLKEIALACSGDFEYLPDESFYPEEFFFESKNLIGNYISEVKLEGDYIENVQDISPIENILYFSYSPFDNYREFNDINRISKVGYGGLNDNQSIDEYMTKILLDTLNNDEKSKDGDVVKRAISGSLTKRKLWNDVITNLSFDKNIKNLMSDLTFYKNNKIGNDVISKLSSGQKILLLSLSKLINEAIDRSLIIIDEPELFLHPPLITSYIREVSKILKATNSLCIIATHSPFVIQEIPESCVYMVERNRENTDVSTPLGRTFGENISVINENIFGTDLRLTGYFKLLTEIVEKDLHIAKSLLNNNEMGFEAESILRILIDKEEKSG